jgi:hypothetical protein
MEVPRALPVGLHFLNGTIFKIPLLLIDEVSSHIGLLIPYIASYIKSMDLPTNCAECGVVISLGYDGYSTKDGEYWCEKCTQKKMENIHLQTKH